MSDNAFIHKEAFRLLCDEEIGRGMGRVVYSSKVLEEEVIKTEEGSGSFQNIIEWETWQRVKGTPFAKWFAPCKWISPCGSVLVMTKTERMQTDQYPEKMPAFLSDFKRANYGLLNGHVVCHDYGTHLMFENGMTRRMQKVQWWVC
jgi:hypothetical protein